MTGARWEEEEQERWKKDKQGEEEEEEERKFSENRPLLELTPIFPEKTMMFCSDTGGLS